MFKREVTVFPKGLLGSLSAGRMEEWKERSSAVHMRELPM